MTPQAPGQEEFEDVEYSKIFDLAVLRLAALESHAYESVRKKEAVKLNVRVSALDAEVKKARRSAEAEPKANGEDADQPQPEPTQDAQVWKSASGLYQISNGRTYRINYTKDAEIRVPLANFSARIVEETTFDDGVEVTKFFTVEGQMHTGRMLPLARVPVTKYGMMNWTADVWGFGPSMSAGQGAKDHLRCAIDEVSGDVVPCRSVFTHLGWRKAPGWV